MSSFYVTIYCSIGLKGRFSDNNDNNIRTNTTSEVTLATYYITTVLCFIMPFVWSNATCAVCCNRTVQIIITIILYAKQTISVF